MCGVSFTVEHALSCPRGGFLFVCHKNIHDFAHLLKEICHNVSVEPGLQPLTGENLHYRSVIKDDQACLDIAASGFWGTSHQHAYFDVHVFNLYAPSFHSVTLSSCFRWNKEEGL